MTLSEMRHWLESKDLQLTKSLGQNFLHDRNQIDRIVEAAQVHPCDSVLEIGPGLGPLTGRLLERRAHVAAVEIDARLVDVLRLRFPAHPSLHLIHADALAWLKSRQERPVLISETEWNVWARIPPAQSELPSQTSGSGQWKVASNLPYSTGSPILVEIASLTDAPARIAATLQLEVVERIASTPGSKNYGLLSLLIGLRYRCLGFFKIPAACFFPEPGVASACVTLVRRDSPLLARPVEKTFVRVVKRAFSQRRKMMKNLLKVDWPETGLVQAFEQCGISPSARAEEIDLERFARLAQILHPA